MQSARLGTGPQRNICIDRRIHGKKIPPELSRHVTRNEVLKAIELLQPIDEGRAAGTDLVICHASGIILTENTIDT